jgi:hypothetical protein
MGLSLMPDTFRIKRRSTGGAGAPATLASAEIAFNEVDNTLWYGKGNAGGNIAATVIPIGGQGLAASSPPLMDGAAAAGTGTTWARGDHRHPTDTSLLPLAGGTMTGALYLSSSQPTLALNAPLAGENRVIIGYTNNVYRWQIVLGDNAGEGGSNAGSNFILQRYTDAGAYAGASITISRANGNPVLVGTPTNDSAPAGAVGEFIEADVTSAVGIANGVWTNVTAISLSAGDWDVEGAVTYGGPTNTTVYTLYACVSLNSADPSGIPPSWQSSMAYPVSAIFSFGSALASIRVGRARVSLAAAATVYLLGYAYFSVSTCSVSSAFINARRVR